MRDDNVWLDLLLLKLERDLTDDPFLIRFRKLDLARGNENFLLFLLAPRDISAVIFDSG